MEARVEQAFPHIVVALHEKIFTMWSLAAVDNLVGRLNAEPNQIIRNEIMEEALREHRDYAEWVQYMEDCFENQKIAVDPEF